MRNAGPSSVQHKSFMNQFLAFDEQYGALKMTDGDSMSGTAPREFAKELREGFTGTPDKDPVEQMKVMPITLNLIDALKPADFARTVLTHCHIGRRVANDGCPPPCYLSVYACLRHRYKGEC